MILVQAAGFVGAWLVMTWWQARREPVKWRASLVACGIWFLVFQVILHLTGLSG